MKNCAIIPARNGSKRIPGKNFRFFNGKPIIVYSIETAIKSNLFDEIIIACDEWPLSDDWKEYVEIYKRDPKNSDDSSTLFDLVKEMYDKEMFEGYDNCCLLYPCAPFTLPVHLQYGLDNLEYGRKSCIFPAVVKNIELFCYDESYNRFCHPLYEDREEPIPNGYHAGQWFFFNIKKIIESGTIIQKYSNGYLELKDYECEDINTQEEWDRAVKKYAMLKAIGER